MISATLKSYRRSVWSAFLRMLAGINLISVEASSSGIRKGFIMHDNLKRHYTFFTPEPVTPGKKLPLVIALHGRGGNGESMILLTRRGFNRLARSEGFIVVYPDGIELNWNDGRTDEESHDRAHKENIDDIGFISGLISLMISEYGADDRRVYVTGISNGAIMAYRLACVLSGRIAAIAPVDGNIPHLLFPDCVPANHVSVLAINNTDDPLVPYNGGYIHGSLSRVSLGRVLSVEESIAIWVRHNNCGDVPEVIVMTDKDPGDGISVTIKKYVNKNDGTEVILYAVHGGGHTWPGGLQYLPVMVIGKTCRDFDANEVIWSFFRKHERL